MPLGPGRQRLGRARWARVGGGRWWAAARIWLPSELGLRCLRPIVGGGPDLAAVGAGPALPAADRGRVAGFGCCRSWEGPASRGVCATH